jgi:hypothetical protein
LGETETVFFCKEKSLVKKLLLHLEVKETSGKYWDFPVQNELLIKKKMLLNLRNNN